METIYDIVGDIRAQNQGLPEDGYALSPYVNDLLSLADRIEAAGKALETDRDNWRKQALDEDARANATSKDSLQVGDIAAMRKALERLREWVLMDLNENAFIADSSGNYMKLIKGTIEIANAALSKPPRNCDIQSVIDDSLSAWLADKDNWDELGDPKKEIHEWLLAEAEGEAK